MEIKRNKLKVGYEFDRYGGKLINGKLEDGGNFIAPMGASFESRALPPYYNNGGVPYNKYKVVKEIPDVAEGAAIPWFGQPGMGTQFKLEKSIDDLLKEGYIERIVETAEQLSKAKLLTKFKGFENIQSLVNQLDDAKDAGLISKLDALESSYFSKLDQDLVHSTYGSEIKALLKESPDDLNDIWKRLKDDPSFSWELQKTGGSRWEAWSKREFFKEVTALGKKFEAETVLKTLKDRSSQWYGTLKSKVFTDFAKNLDDYDMFSQVQLKYDGDNYFVADQVFVKYDDFGGVEDIVVIENKLKNSTALTIPQTDALKHSNYEVRSINKASEFNSTNQLNQGDLLEFEGNIKWYKVYDSDKGDVITGINKL